MITIIEYSILTLLAGYFLFTVILWISEKLGY